MATIGLGASFSSPGATIALPCGLSISLPSWVLGFSLSISIPFPPKFPPFDLSFFFKLSCDLTNPVSLTAGVPWGGGRESNAPPDPDDSETDATF